MYARTNRCYNERGSRTNSVRSSILHCTLWSVIWCSHGNGRGRDRVLGVATRLQAGRSEIRIPAGETDFLLQKPSRPPLEHTQHTATYVTGVKAELKDTWSCNSTLPTRLDRVYKETFTFFPRKWVSRFQYSWMSNTLQKEEADSPETAARMYQLHGVKSQKTKWCVLRLRIEERPPVWRVAANVLNKQSRTADKVWSSSLEIGRGANNCSP